MVVTMSWCLLYVCTGDNYGVCGIIPSGRPRCQAVASAHTIHTWLGDQAFDKLLRYFHTESEAEIAPIWGQYDHFHEQLSEDHLTLMADMSVGMGNGH